MQDNVTHKQIVQARQVSHAGQSGKSQSCWFHFFAPEALCPQSEAFTNTVGKGPNILATLFLAQKTNAKRNSFCLRPKIICLYNIETYYPRARAHMRHIVMYDILVRVQDNQAKPSHFQAFWSLTKFAGISCGVPQAKSESGHFPENR